jgi:sacsin
MQAVEAACREGGLLSSWPSQGLPSPEEAAGLLLDHLDRQGLSREQAAAAATAAFLPVAGGGRLVPPGRVFLRLPARGGGGGAVGGGAGLAPFAFELPLALQGGGRLALLRSIGVRDEPSARDLVCWREGGSTRRDPGDARSHAPQCREHCPCRTRLLQLLPQSHTPATHPPLPCPQPRPTRQVESVWAFSQALAGRRLNPNELAAALRVLSFLATASDASDRSYLAAARKASAGAPAAAPVQGAAPARPLLAPAASGALAPAARLVAAEGGLAGARLLGRVDPSAVALAHPALPRHVARWLGVPSLGDVVGEALVEEEGPPEEVPALGGVTRGALAGLLGGEPLAAAVYSVVAAHAGALPALREAARGGPRGIGTALRRLAGRLTLVRELRTRLALRGGGGGGSSGGGPVAGGSGSGGWIDVTQPGKERVFEFDDAPNGRWYVAAPPPGLPLSALLAAVLSRALDSPVVLPLAPLLEAGVAALREADASGGGSGGGGGSAVGAALGGLVPLLLPGHDAAYEAAAAAGLPGAPLLEADARLLALQPLRHWAAGEVAAYRRSAAPGAAAAAAAESRAGGGSGAAGGGGGGLCYARVAADAAPPPGPAAALATVPLELAPGEFGSLPASQVFCFKSGAEAEGEAAAAAAAAAAAPAAAPAPAPGRGAATAAAAPRGGGAAAAPAAAEDGAAGAVGAPQLAAAVSDMLAAAGMPLDLEREALLSKALSAARDASEARAALSKARRDADEARARAEEVEAGWQCRVCFSATVDAAFVACGHMFCRACVAQIGGGRCPVCRKSSQVIKLFK